MGEDASFTVSPVDLDAIWFIEPMGKLHGGHVTPTDHTYINHVKREEFETHSQAVQGGQAPKAWTPPYDVRSPADGFIVDIGAFPFGPAPYGYSGVMEDYRVVIWHTCAVSTIYIHMAGLAPEIVSATGESSGGSDWRPLPGSLPLAVEAGQIIGRVGSQGIDFSVHDTRQPSSGFVVPAHYQGEPWKIYTVDPFDYFAEPLRSQLQAKSPRTVGPVGGKIDYDIEGRLVGNWFLEGTEDYSGGSAPTMCGTRPCPYWNGHLAIAYDHIDGSQIRISIGADVGITEEQCNVCQGAYGVLSNGPDPATIGVESGLVKYDLVAREHVGELRVETRNDESRILGAFLVQVLDDHSIRVEVAVGQTAAQIDGFSDAANIYRR